MANVGSQKPVAEVKSEATWLEKSLPFCHVAEDV